MIESIKISPHNFDSNALVHECLLNNGNMDGFIILESEGTEQSGKSYILTDPVLKIWADNNASYIETADKEPQKNKDPWHALNNYLLPQLSAERNLLNMPLVAGYMSYELLHLIENVPEASKDSSGIPLYVFYLYSRVIEINNSQNKQAVIHEFKFNNYDKVFWEAAALKANSSPSLHTTPAILDEAVDFDAEKYSNFSRSAYCQTVSQIKDLINEGEVYQVNLSQQFNLPYKNEPAAFYLNLREVSPSAYLAFINISGKQIAPFSIASSSPERFFTCDGQKVLCSPIKGTRPRVADYVQDQEKLADLMKCEKDHAELSMIVDLLRNDLGKVAEVGSVKVLQHARTVSNSYVHHLVSDIECKLKQEAGLPELIKALFPCGSISGAPKIAAMNLISKFEKTPRRVYTGAIGYFGTRLCANFNVAIRTVLIQNEILSFQSGGGIVADSIPEAEYDETITKSRGIVSAWRRS